MKTIRFIAVSWLMFASSAVLSAEPKTTQCTFGKNVRLIEIAYPEGTETPCEVKYTKNGETRVLWSARAERGYCEEKAAAFIEKQESWGWQCEPASDGNSDEVSGSKQESKSEENDSEETS